VVETPREAGPQTARAALQIGAHRIARDAPVFVIAEMSANHLGKLERAHAIIDAAAEAGADAIKLQTYRPDTITLDSNAPEFRIGAGTPWEGQRLYDIYAEAATPWEWHGELFAHAAEVGLEAFSSPFDLSAVEFLESFDPPAYKIASFEAVDIGLIEACARTGKPLIISTGMATQEEVQRAVEATARGGAAGPKDRARSDCQVALLKCTSAYPAPVAEMNLRSLESLAQFGVPVGLSDHSLDDAVASAAIALGARIVERHLTLAREDGGPDASFSAEPEEFARGVAAIRRADAALGHARIAPTEAEKATRALRRSLYVVEDIARGEAFEARHLRSVRPAEGLAPRHLSRVLGRRARQDLAAGSPLRASDVEGFE